MGGCDGGAWGGLPVRWHPWLHGNDVQLDEHGRESVCSEANADATIGSTTSTISTNTSSTGSTNCFFCFCWSLI
jgi:hypothetical protein